MKKRCYQEGHISFKNYGRRGIAVCDYWRHSFAAFYEDMGPCPEEYTLERIDVNGNYEPENCRWASYTEQHRNNRRVSYRGENLTCAEWAEQFGIRQSVFMGRINNGWLMEKIRDTPESERIPRTNPSRASRITITHNGETAPIGWWAEKVGLSSKLIRKRLSYGWSAERILTTPPKTKDRTRKPITYNGKTASMRWWAEKTGLNYELIVSRLRSGWSVENTLTVPANWKGRYVVLEVNGEKVYVPNSEVSDFIKKHPDAEFPS